MNQKESKLSFKNIFQRETKLATYIIACCTILVLGISYAVFFQVNQNSNNQVVEAGDLTFTYQDGNQITNANDNFCFEPMSDDEANLYGSECSYQFSVQNTGSLMGSYTLTLNATESNTAPSTQVKVILKKQNAEGVLETVEGYPETLGNISNGVLVENATINTGESIVYSIQLYVDESTVSDPNVENSTAFNIDYIINGTGTVHESQPISTDKTAAETIEDLVSSNPDQLVYDETADNNLRYIGADPNNYVRFNNELWRIIGAFNNIDDGTGTKETRLKIIRNEPIGEYSWDNKASGTGSSTSSNGSNDWSDSALQIVLNSGAYWNRTSGECPYGSNGATTSCDFSNIGLTSEAKTMISNAVWNLGGSSTLDDVTASTFYEREIGTTVYTGRPTEWTGQIGLMYPSDYGYATSGGSITDRASCLATELYNWDNISDCYNNDWLYKSGTNQWTLTPDSDLSYRVFYVYSYGAVDLNNALYATYAVSPALYLSSNVRISGGTGVESDPFTLEIG